MYIYKGLMKQIMAWALMFNDVNGLSGYRNSTLLPMTWPVRLSGPYVWGFRYTGLNRRTQQGLSPQDLHVLRLYLLPLKHSLLTPPRHLPNPPSPSLILSSAHIPASTPPPRRGPSTRQLPYSRIPALVFFLTLTVKQKLNLGSLVIICLSH